MPAREKPRGTFVGTEEGVESTIKRSVVGWNGLRIDGAQPPVLETHGFRKTAHQIEVLYRRASCTFDKIIETTDRKDTAFDDAECDIAKVRMGGVFGCRKVLDNADERVWSVESMKQFK